jgi:hypothetical protein
MPFAPLSVDSTFLHRFPPTKIYTGPFFVCLCFQPLFAKKSISTVSVTGLGSSPVLSSTPHSHPPAPPLHPPHPYTPPTMIFNNHFLWLMEENKQKFPLLMNSIIQLSDITARTVLEWEGEQRTKINRFCLARGGGGGTGLKIVSFCFVCATFVCQERRSNLKITNIIARRFFKAFEH